MRPDFYSIRSNFTFMGSRFKKDEIACIDHAKGKIFIIPDFNKNNNLVDSFDLSEEFEQLIKENGYFLLIC